MASEGSARRVLYERGVVSLAAPLVAGDVAFEDPAGDDNGPGTYVYPTDAVYTPGSFDLVGFEIEDKGKKLNVGVSLNANLDDPWGMDVGFATQMIHPIWIKPATSAPSVMGATLNTR